MEFLPDSWSTLWTLETPVLELLARGAFMYLGILFLLRVMPRRSGGELATMDLVMLLLVTESATHSLGDYSSLADGFFLILTVMGIDYAVNALSYHVPWFERLVSSPPLPLVLDGKLQRRNMRREFVTEEELNGLLRAHDVDDLSQVKRAYVESEGEITVVTRKDGDRNRAGAPRP
ncbi:MULTISPECIES: YetF domain-containing protein [unclassified Luteimonas]|uniref:DUF421 domain-containing protein n=1 Tax=unclassified Luteimonas TaxID=2629088 RepID=UPI0018F0DD64|nr:MULTISPECIES: YetF domain-containing protein [unclassified Luteimonas]MBJ6979772.1 DUF421 domain-containing protein [Luteimonas sp. MC1895]MBJ6985536.1 DUF421 domain-containing protein [Luteimonas sp. MC1750]QQO05979.1 DUF421 domain-containing protein [Luteimonas sp. MC1750]